MKKTAKLLACLTCALLLWGCSSAEPSRSGTGMGRLLEAVRGGDGPGAFALLESVLLAARTVRIEASLTSRGEVVSSLEGEIALQGTNMASGRFSGRLAEQPVELHLRSDGRRLIGGSRKETFDEKAPEALNEALIIGLTRMGLLHNLVLCARGKIPEHANGGGGQWVTTSVPEAGAVVRLGDVSALPVSFEISVDGRRSARATLWLDVATGFPVERSQIVHFPSGDMEVMERYSSFAVDEEVDPRLFRPYP